MTVFRGSVSSGVLSNVYKSDDTYLVLRPGAVFSSSEAPVQLILIGTSPVATTTELRFSLEANSSASNITQKIEFYNPSTTLYELMDTRTATTTDSVAEVVVSSNPSRFIDSGTLAVRAKISGKAQGAVFAFPWLVKIDRAVWNIKR